MKTPGDSPALVRAGERWGFAAYLWFGASEDGGEWHGKVCWNPGAEMVYVDACIRTLCERAGMTAKKIEPEDEIA